MLTSPGRAEEDDRFAGVQPAQRGQVAQHGGGEFGVGGEVEVFEGGLFLEAGAAQSSGEGG